MKIELKDKLKSVRVFGVDYQVIYCEDQRDVNPRGDELLRGHLDFHINTIRIYAGMNEVEQKKAILHEVIHIISTELQIELREADVARFETGLWSVIVNNPVLFGGKDGQRRS